MRDAVTCSRLNRFKDVNAITSGSTEGSADIMQSSEANNSTSNVATDIFGSEHTILSQRMTRIL